MSTCAKRKQPAEPAAPPPQRRGRSAGRAAAAVEEDDNDEVENGAATAAAADSAAAPAASSGAAGPSISRGKPTAESLPAHLVQALENSDVTMLDDALLVQDPQIIASTIARLPIEFALPLLEAVLKRVQGRPARVAGHASWLRALLAQHAAYLMDCPEIMTMLAPLFTLIDERLNAFKPLLKLVGRMQMLQSQIAAQEAATLEGGDGPSDDPVLTFDDEVEDEATRDEEEEGEEDDEEGEEEDDDEDDFDDDEEDEEERFGYGEGDEDEEDDDDDDED